MRDFQVSKVYSAERSLPCRTFKGTDDALSWLKKITAAENKSVSFVVDNKLSSWAYCESQSKIVFPGKSDWWHDELILLHELAHTNIHWAFPAHGIEFCKEYLRLVKLYCSNPVMYCKLKQAFDHRNVKYDSRHRNFKYLSRKVKSSSNIVLSDGTIVFGKFDVHGSAVVETVSNHEYNLKSVVYADV